MEKQFLIDYLDNEIELSQEHLKNNPDKPSNDPYPPIQRFPKLHKPYTLAVIGKNAPIWPQMLCTGSLIIPLVPQKDEKQFNDTYGFSSKEIDNIIQFSKDTGRIQFVLESFPIDFQNLQFLEPIFKELRPPLLLNPHGHLSKKRLEALVEIETIIDLNEQTYFAIWNNLQGSRSTNLDLFNKRVNCGTYANLRVLGFDEIADEIIDNILIDPSKASALLAVSQAFITNPMINPFQVQFSVNYERAVLAKKILRTNFDVNKSNIFPCEIGAFLLNRKSFNPKNFVDSQRALEIYSDNQFYQVYLAFNEAVSTKNYSVLDTEVKNLNEIFTQIWDDAESIIKTKEWIKKPIDFSIAGIGLSIATLTSWGTITPDKGLLLGLGYLAANSLIGDYVRNDIPEYISRHIEKPYNITIYDFKHSRG